MGGFKRPDVSSFGPMADYRTRQECAITAVAAGGAFGGRNPAVHLPSPRQAAAVVLSNGRGMLLCRFCITVQLSLSIIIAQFDTLNLPLPYQKQVISL
jgi:hypothetical protein